MQIENLSFDYGDKVIFKNVNVNLSSGEKIGLIGQNGAGKTTFFKIVLGTLLPTTGKIILKKGTKVEWLPQIIADDYMEKEMTAQDYILAGRPIAKLEEKLNEIYSEIACADEKTQKNLISQAQNIQETLESYDWYEYENIMKKIVYNMKISDEILNKKISELSGGQKSKIAFARLLYSKQDIMLLDEPTNHLDEETKKFVIDFLKSYKGTVLIISHDIDFLNEVTNKTLFFDHRTHDIMKYNGNYSVFEKLHSEYEARIIEEARKQDVEIEKLKKVINKFEGTSGKRKRLAQDREKKLDKILSERIIVQPQNKKVDFDMEVSKTENDIPIRISGMTFSYPNMKRNIISKLSFDINKSEKFLVVGPNGAGKSTLLKLIARQLSPNKGKVILGDRVKIGYYAQEHENLVLEKTILENFSEYEMSSKKLRSMLAHFLFFGDEVNKKVSVLSPGERARVALAKLAMSGCNTILLDEPTNHLDPETQTIIAEVFKKFSGTMLVVSHNPNFVDSLGVERMLILPEGKITYYKRSTVEKYQKINTKKLD